MDADKNIIASTAVLEGAWRPERFAPRIGGRYDMAISLLRVVLPCLAIVLTLTTALLPVFIDRETSFVLARDRVEASEDRLRMVNPRYSGIDNDDRPFQVRAESAVQPRGIVDEVTLTGISADIEMAGDVDIAVAAGSGTYRTADEMLTLSGPVQIKTSSGYHIDASDSLVDLDDHLVTSEQAVDAAGPLGRFQAKGFEARIDEDRLMFNGGVKAVILPRRVRLPVTQPSNDMGVIQ